MNISRSLSTIAVAIALIFLTAASVAPRADVSLVGLWHLDEESGPTVSDSSGNANDGTIFGDSPTLVPGLFGNGLAFSPWWQDYVQIPGSESLNVSGSYTFEAWVYLPSGDCWSETWQGLFRRGYAWYSSSQLEIYVQPCSGNGSYHGTLTVAHNRGPWGPGHAFANFPTVPRDTWFHLAVTWNGQGIPKAFYNGVGQPRIDGAGTFTDPAISDPPQPNYIGLGHYVDNMRGILDEVHLWNLALTDTEILHHAAAAGISVDIKPGSADNAINLASNGVVPVALLTIGGFDASSVDPSTLKLAGASPVANGKSGNVAALEDVNGDGDLDLVVHFPINLLELTADDTEAVLTGADQNGVPFRGSDTIRIVPRQK